MAVRIQLRRDTAANWVSANPTLRAGEIGIETDTLKFKVGNGSSPWNSITAYANVVPSDLNNSLNGYVQVSDIGAVNGVVGLNADQDAIIPGMAIIFEGETADAFETTLEVADPTSDNVVTIPDATTTLVGTDTTDTLTNKTLTSPVVSGLTLSDASIVFEGAVADSYETTLTVGEPTDDRTLTLPDATDTLVGRATTDTLTNKTLTSPVVSGLYLSDSSIVFEGTANDHETTLTVTDPTVDRTLTLPDATGTVALTSDITSAINALSTTDIEEGTNQYFTDERAQDAVAAAIAAGTHTNITITYNDNANSLSFTGAVTYTDENAQDAVGNAVGNGLDYDDNTGAISVDPSEFALSAVGTPTANIDMGAYKITNLGTPTASGDAATKAYVDNTTAGLNFHAAVHAATTANLDATYANGTGGVGATLTANANGALVVDGHTLNASERVLVKNQTTGSENGIYEVTSTGDVSNPWVLTRATDADNSPAGEVAYGDFTFVQQGSTNAGFGYIVNTTGTITIGTTAISYTQFNAGQVVVAGNGLTEATPGTLSIDTGVTVDLSTAQTLTNKTITGTFTGNLTGNADTVTNGVYTNAANTITAASDSTKPLIIKGAASQTVNLQEWQNSSGGVDTAVTSTGRLSVRTTLANAGLNVGAPSASTVAAIIRGAASQTANLQEWQDSTGAIVSRINNNGNLIVPSQIRTSFVQDVNLTGSRLNFNSLGTNSGSILLQTIDAANIGLIVRGTASQTANLQEWQNSAGTVLSRINSSGNFVVPTIASTYNISVTAGSSSVIPMTVKGAASQTANLQEWQNSSGTVLMAVNSSGAISTGTWNGTAVGPVYGGTGLTSYTTGDVLYASDTNTLSKLAAGTNGYLLTMVGGVPAWAAAPISLPDQTGNSGKYLTTDGTTASWATLVVPIETGTATLTANTATTISTTALSAFTSIEYMVSLKQGSKVRTSKVVLQTDGSSVDMTEFAITETGGQMTGVVISATTSGSDAVLQATVTDASSTNVDVKFSKVKL